MKRTPFVLAVLLLLAACKPAPPPSWTGYAEGELLYLSAPVAGRVQRLHVAAGDAVTAGQLLFEFDPTLEKAASAEAEARSRSAASISVGRGPAANARRVPDHRVPDRKAVATVAVRALAAAFEDPTATTITATSLSSADTPASASRWRRVCTSAGSSPSTSAWSAPARVDEMISGMSVRAW